MSTRLAAHIPTNRNFPLAKSKASAAARWVSAVNAEGLGFGIPYLNDGQMHDYVPDFLVRLKDLPGIAVILETKALSRAASVCPIRAIAL